MEVVPFLFEKANKGNMGNPKRRQRSVCLIVPILFEKANKGNMGNPKRRQYSVCLVLPTVISKCQNNLYQTVQRAQGCFG